jgi:hypothetical protein
MNTNTAIKKWEHRTRAKSGPFAEDARDAEIAELRAALAKADEHCEEMKRIQHEQACRVTHALMAERDEWKAKASQAEAAPVERDKDGNHADDLRHMLDELQAKYDQQENAFMACSLKLQQAEAAVAQRAASVEASNLLSLSADETAAVLAWLKVHRSGAASVEAQPVSTTRHAEAINALLAVATAAYEAMDNSEERTNATGGEDAEYIIQGNDFTALSAAMDDIDALPDDRPGYTLAGGARASWALRDLFTAPPAQPDSGRDAARYRWLRSDDIEVLPGQREINVVKQHLPFREDQRDEVLTESALDEAIDAAMAAPPIGCWASSACELCGLLKSTPS